MYEYNNIFYKSYDTLWISCICEYVSKVFEALKECYTLGLCFCWDREFD